MSGYWLWRLIDIFYYCDYVTVTHLIPFIIIGQQKKYRILYHQSYHLIEKPVITFFFCNHFLKSRYISELSWNFLKNINAQVVLLFFCQSSRYISNEQPFLKTTGLCDDLLLLSSLLHFFYFISNAPISFSLCFAISPSLSFLDFLSQALSKCSRKAFVYIYICIICIIHIF